MRKPWLLDLFSGGGLGALGYQAAGWRVFGVDTEGKYESTYPGERFKRADALRFLERHGHKFAAVHASPPCPGYSRGTVAVRARGRHYERLIAPTRDLLVALPRRVPWVIENVEGARGHLVNPLRLCGTMFGLRATDDDGETLWLQRHRLFETNFPAAAPGPCDHPRDLRCGGVYGGGRADKDEARYVRRGGYTPSGRHVQEQLMGVPAGRFTHRALKDGIPPVYGEHLGRAMLGVLR